METKLMTLAGNNPEKLIYCVMDMDISEYFVLQVVASNQDYFNMLKKYLTQYIVLKFEQHKDKIIMRTFSNEGHQAATYCVKENNMLFLYNEAVHNNVFYRKNGLHVVEYEENNEGVMIYRMLDDNDLDPVGDGFTLDEAVMFAENYLIMHE